jgi:hypothetical protein
MNSRSCRTWAQTAEPTSSIGPPFETALPNECLVETGRRKVSLRLGGRRFRMSKKCTRVPASVPSLRICTDDANQDHRGTGIEKVRIMSSLLFEQVPARFRDGLEKLGTEKKLNLARVESGSRVEESQLEIGLAKPEAALLEARVAVSHLQVALDAERLGTERLEREVHQTRSREELVSGLTARLPEAIGAMKVDSCNVLATGADAASPLAKALVEIVTKVDTRDALRPPPSDSYKGATGVTAGIVQSMMV